MVEEISISVDDAAAFSSPEEGELEEIEGESVSRRRRSRHLAVDCTLHVSQTDDARNCGSQCNVTNINEALSMHEGAWHYSSEAVKISIQAGPKSEQCLSPKMSADPSPECSATTRLLRNAEGGSGCELLSIVKHSEVDDPLPEISAPTDSHLPSPHETVTPCSAEGVSLLVSDRKDVDVIIDRASKLYTVSMIARGTGTQSCDETDERVANGDYEDSTDLATNAQDCFSDCKGLNVNADERNDGGSSIIVNTGCGEIPTAAIKHEDETEEMAHLEAAGALSIEHASLCSRERERAISVVTGGDNGGTVDTSLNALKFSTHRTSNETQLEEPQIIAHSTAEDDLDASKSLLNEPVSVLAPASPEPPATIATILTTEGSPIVPAIVYRAATVLESPKDPVALAHSPQDEMQKYSSSSSTAPPVGTVDDFSELMADDLELEKDFDVVGLIDAFFT
ncbi:hypothetical protein DFJ73DRAFT_135379 [Zopfochytrium polystomum]|nr:hypothetical protein DFJ73DRAFT_135379 [Zopfochytrium polystomum]